MTKTEAAWMLRGAIEQKQKSARLAEIHARLSEIEETLQSSDLLDAETRHILEARAAALRIELWSKR